MTVFYHQLLWAALAVLSLLILCCLFRAVRGPKAADRLVAVNMITTLVTIGICILTLLLKESYLADVALIFSLLGCLAVVVLTKVLLSRLPRESGGREAGRHVE